MSYKKCLISIVCTVTVKTTQFISLYMPVHKLVLFCNECANVQLGLSPTGREFPLQVLGDTVLRKRVVTEREEVTENCVSKRLVVCTLHSILTGR